MKWNNKFKQHNQTPLRKNPISLQIPNKILTNLKKNSNSYKTIPNPTKTKGIMIVGSSAKETKISLVMVQIIKVFNKLESLTKEILINKMLLHLLEEIKQIIEIKALSKRPFKNLIN